MVLAVLLWVLLQMVQALVAGETGSAVSYGAHFGGLGAGLLLALLLGQARLGRLETVQARARRDFRRGNFYSAVGLWTEYLEMVPGDTEALLERARCLRLVQQGERARVDYDRALKGVLARGGGRNGGGQGDGHPRDLDEALEIYREMRRAGLSALLAPDILAGLALQQEKMGDYEGALDTYRDLQEKYPQLSAGRRALVRMVHLYHGKAADAAQAAYWLKVACRTLPGGNWREYLVREFSPEARPGAGDGAGPRAPHPSAGS